MKKKMKKRKQKTKNKLKQSRLKLRSKPKPKRTKKLVARNSRNDGQPRYTLNRDFQFIQELKDLMLKSSPAEKEEITDRLQKLGKIKLAIVAGVFLNKENQENVPTDIFIVSDDLDRRKFSKFLKYLEAETGGEVRFVIMEKDEFTYRLSMFDRFVRVLLEGPHEKLINRLGL
ncbi:MAG: hypothetical protein HYX21_03315 [Candidatus Yanofskybacteria bacterium]|nr:hypothetical protein [Candidatus Yanofskybacteria bacterium]